MSQVQDDGLEEGQAGQARQVGFEQHVAEPHRAVLSRLAPALPAIPICPANTGTLLIRRSLTLRLS
ncbi:hypothetical protein AJ88_46985 [Mesorhizobium amorphae CCBAU 01583]|nr:hypothetical protein AJ88_46985 [Mesorhizobium amorphae CCBAU 01583]